MTVQVINDNPTEQIAEEKTEISQEKPYMYTDSETVYTDYRTSTANRNIGFGSVAIVQLLIAAVLGTGLWAALNFGSDDVKQICESLTELFR